MQRNLVLLLGAVITWGIFGAIIGAISSVIVGYSWVTNAMILGATVGAFIGLGVGVLGLAAVGTQRSRDVFTWVVGGSILGAIIGFGTVIIIGGFPRRSQADLSFIGLAPLGLILGGFSGTVVGVNLWKSRRNLH